MLHTVVVCCRNYVISSVALPCVCMCESVYVYALEMPQTELQTKKVTHNFILPSLQVSSINILMNIAIKCYFEPLTPFFESPQRFK